MTPSRLGGAGSAASAGLSAPAPAASPVPPSRRSAGRLRQWFECLTAAKIIGLAVTSALLSLTAGGLSYLAVDDRADRLDEVAVRSDPVSSAALAVYRLLSDADSLLAEAFLAGTPTSTGEDTCPADGADAGAGRDSEKCRNKYAAELYDRYRADITRTVAELETAAAFGASAGYERPADRDAFGDPGVTACGAPTGYSQVTAVAELSNCLQAYTGLVETARTYNRLGLPQGSTYLRTASELLRNTMLPIARQLYETERGYKTDELRRADAMPWAELILCVAAAVWLLAVLLYLAWRTNRMINWSLLVAMVATLAGTMLVWDASADARRHIQVSQREGTDQVCAFAELRITALQARAAEALTLTFRGNGAEFEKEFGPSRLMLTGSYGVPKMGFDGGRVAGEGRPRAAAKVPDNVAGVPHDAAEGGSRVAECAAGGSVELPAGGSAGGSAEGGGRSGALAEARARVSQAETRAALDAATDKLIRWMDVHEEVRELDDAGKHKEAVAIATGDDPGSSATLAHDFDMYLDKAIVHADKRFDDATENARAALNGADVFVFFVLLLGVPVLSAAWFMWTTVREYL